MTTQDAKFLRSNSLLKKKNASEIAESELSHR